MRLFVLCCLSVVAYSQEVPRPPFPRQDEVHHSLPEGKNIVPGEYLIKLSTDLVSKSDIQAFRTTLTSKYGVDVRRELSVGNLNILHVATGDASVMDTVSGLAEVDLYSPNFLYSVTQDVASCNNRDHPYTWGIDRLDQRHKLVESYPFEDSTYTYGLSDAGQGVTVYVVDSGVDVNHPEFEGRAWHGFSAEGMDGDQDLYGHGTHVAGTVGSKSYGVAKRVTIKAVKVFNVTGTGSTLAIIDGLRWILQDHGQNYFTSGQIPKSVINMSLGGKGFDPIYTAVVNELIKGYITVVVSAGNDNDNACSQMPASVPDAITVGAIDVNDTTTDFTNWGECVDIFAPGHDILSTYPNQEEMMFPGTSMAAPHVAGVVARYMSMHPEAKTPAEVTDWLLSSATKKTLTFLTPDHATSPDRLLFMSCDPSASGASGLAGLAGVWIGLMVWGLL